MKQHERSHTELSSCFFFFLYMAVLHTKSVLGNQFAHLGPVLAFLVFIDEMGLSVGLQPADENQWFGSVGPEFCQVWIMMDHTRNPRSGNSLQKSSTSQVCKWAGLWVKRMWGSFWSVSFLCKIRSSSCHSWVVLGFFFKVSCSIIKPESHVGVNQWIT